MSDTTLRQIADSTFAPMLENLSAILDKATAFAASSGADLAEARLAPDMYTLAQQVQIATHFAVEAYSRLGGAEPRPFADAETSLEGMKAQIARSLEAIRTAQADALAGAAERDCSVVIPPINSRIEMNGEQFLLRWCVPNFYFHLVTAYDILRNAGVEIGKQDYLASIAPLIKPLG